MRILLFLFCLPCLAAEPVQKANYELATRWTPAKVGKLVFDTAVTPHWLDTGDRFWYTWENSKGRRFYMVDPVKKTKTQVFDATRLAALLTEKTGVPFESQHLPIRTIKYVKGDGCIQFDLDVPKDAAIPGREEGPRWMSLSSAVVPRRAAGAIPASINKTLTFEYDLGSSALTMLPERTPRKPRWVSVAPDDSVVVFSRNQNLFMMDAANYAKALKKPTDTTIVETQLTTDGVEDFGYTRRAGDVERQQGPAIDRAGAHRTWSSKPIQKTRTRAWPRL